MVQSANITVGPSTLWLYVVCSMGNTLWTVVHILDWHRAPTQNTLVAHFCWICGFVLYTQCQWCVLNSSAFCSVPVLWAHSQCWVLNTVSILCAQFQCCVLSAHTECMHIRVCAQKWTSCFVSSLLPLQQYKYIYYYYYCFFFYTSFSKVTSALALSSFCTR